MKERLVVATGNQDKIREIKSVVGDKFEIVSLKDVGFVPTCVEDGATFKDNARIKAKEVVDKLKVTALADDSGLVCESLGGAPGIYSARYSGIFATNEKNNALLLKNLEDKENRRGKYVCVMALIYPDGRELYGYGETDGVILKEYDGNEGFGYDPIFYSTELDKSFGRASLTEKNTVSHRARALKDLLKQLEKKGTL